MNSLLNAQPMLPIGIVFLTAISLLMLEVFAVGTDRGWASSVTVFGLAIALYSSFTHIAEPSHTFFGSVTHAAPVVVDGFANLSWVVMLSGALIVSLMSPEYLQHARAAHGEYYALILFALIGMMVMAMAADLLTLFLGLELMSIAVYVLTGIRRNDPRAAEAALKYFLMGAFATGFLLFGISLVYGGTGVTNFRDLARAIGERAGDVPITTLGMVLILVGFGFKLAAVPFHLWAPDVYEGAATPVTGFMAVGVKAAAFVGLLRLVVVSLGAPGAPNTLVIHILSGLAVLTILVGNVVALVQRNIKRMLAYSSISHAGYALIGVIAAARGEKTAASAVMFYLTAYTFMTLGAFGVLAFLERKEGSSESERFGAFAGIGFKHPALGLAMSLFMVALAGMPPTGGFFGKLYLFSAALNVGLSGLVIVGITGSLISVYYYLRVIVAFYMRDVPDPGPLPAVGRSRSIIFGLALAAFAVLELGIFPGQWIEIGRTAVRSLHVG